MSNPTPANDAVDPVTGLPILHKDGIGGPLTAAHQSMQVRHPDDMDWTNLRYEGQFAKMLFHPTADDRTIPNAGIVRYQKGSSHPLHNHYFAQVWYIIDGLFEIDGKEHGAGTMIFHPDPHFEHALMTKEDGHILYVQYMGPTTQHGPIYDGRFNVTQRKRVEDESAAV